MIKNTSREVSGNCYKDISGQYVGSLSIRNALQLKYDVEIVRSDDKYNVNTI